MHQQTCGHRLGQGSCRPARGGGRLESPVSEVVHVTQGPVRTDLPTSSALAFGRGSWAEARAGRGPGSRSPLPGVLGRCARWGMFEETERRWEGTGGGAQSVRVLPDPTRHLPTSGLPAQDRGAECPPSGPWAGTFLRGDEVRQGRPPTSPSPTPPWQGQAGHLWVSNVRAAAEAREGAWPPPGSPTTPVPLGPGASPTPTPGRRRDPLWLWPQTSGFPSARGRPGWEAPTPGRGFPGAPRESGLRPGLCEAARPRAGRRAPGNVSGGDPGLRGVSSPNRRRRGRQPQGPVHCPCLGSGGQ